jgi:hypothetical protein
VLRATSDTTAGFSGISLRIGWCQPGENMPDTMSATGTPSIADDAEVSKTPSWSRSWANFSLL